MTITNNRQLFSTSLANAKINRIQTFLARPKIQEKLINLVHQQHSKIQILSPLIINSPVTSRNGNTFSYEPQPVAAPTNFGRNAFGQNNQNRNYQPTPMSINTRNTNRPNNNNPPRPNNNSIA